MEMTTMEQPQIQNQEDFHPTYIITSIAVLAPICIAYTKFSLSMQFFYYGIRQLENALLQENYTAFAYHEIMLPASLIFFSIFISQIQKKHRIMFLTPLFLLFIVVAIISYTKLPSLTPKALLYSITPLLFLFMSLAYAQALKKTYNNKKPTKETYIAILVLTTSTLFIYSMMKTSSYIEEYKNAIKFIEKTTNNCTDDYHVNQYGQLALTIDCNHAKIIDTSASNPVRMQIPLNDVRKSLGLPIPE
jgi:hypothetical protein